MTGRKLARISLLAPVLAAGCLGAGRQDVDTLAETYIQMFPVQGDSLSVGAVKVFVHDPRISPEQVALAEPSIDGLLRTARLFTDSMRIGLPQPPADPNDLEAAISVVEDPSLGAAGFSRSSIDVYLVPEHPLADRGVYVTFGYRSEHLQSPERQDEFRTALAEQGVSLDEDLLRYGAVIAAPFSHPGIQSPEDMQPTNLDYIKAIAYTILNGLAHAVGADDVRIGDELSLVHVNGDPHLNAEGAPRFHPFNVNKMRFYLTQMSNGWSVAQLEDQRGEVFSLYMPPAGGQEMP